MLHTCYKKNISIDIGILTVYVYTKPEVDSADRASEVSTLTEGFVFTLYRNIKVRIPFITWFKLFTSKGRIKNKQ